MKQLFSHLAVAAGFTLHIAIGYLYLIVGLGVPAPFLMALWAAWGALLLRAVQRRNNPWYVLATPLIAALIWLVVVFGGGSLFDWQA